MSSHSYAVTRQLAAFTPAPIGPPPWFLPLSHMNGLTGADGKVVRTQCWPRLGIQVPPAGTERPPEDWWGQDQIYFIATFSSTGAPQTKNDIMSGYTLLHASLTPQLMPSQNAGGGYSMVYSAPPEGLVSKTSYRGTSDTLVATVSTGFYIGSQSLNTFQYPGVVVRGSSFDMAVWEASPRPS